MHALFAFEPGASDCEAFGMAYFVDVLLELFLQEHLVHVAAATVNQLLALCLPPELVEVGHRGLLVADHVLAHDSELSLRDWVLLGVL